MKINSYILKINGAVEVPSELVLTPGKVRKDCVVCNTSFVSKRCAKRLYCSEKCATLVNKKKLERRINIVCLNCKTNFIVCKSRENTARYCSYKCAAEIRKGVPLSKQVKMKISAGNIGKKMSESSKEKIRKSKLGEKSHFWRGGVTSENLKIRSSAKMKEWRKSVFDRDNYKCVICGTKGCRKNPINADHIKSFSMHPDLRFDINNGRTLCVPCHRKTDTWGVNARFLHEQNK